MLLFHVFHNTYSDNPTTATETLDATTAGFATHYGQTDFTGTLVRDTAGHANAHGATVAFSRIDLGSNFLGRINARGATTATETLTAGTAGTRRRYGATAFTGTLTADTLGQIDNIRLYSVRVTATNSGGSDTKTRTDYIVVRTHAYGATQFVGVLNASTIPGGDNTKHWSVRVTVANEGGSNTDTKTDYITVLQPDVAVAFDGLLQAQTLGHTIHKGAATSFTGTLTASTVYIAHGATEITGTLTAGTVPKLKAKAQAGWGTSWGTTYGGASAFNTGPTLGLAATTQGSSSGAVLGAFTATETLVATTVPKVAANGNATSATISLGAVTAGKRIRYGATAFTGVLNATTVSSSSSLNQTSATFALGASTVGKVKAKGALTFTGALTATIVFGGLPDLTEFTDVTRNLSETTDAARNLSEDTDSTRTLTGVAG